MESVGPLHRSGPPEDAKEFVGGGAGLKCTFTVAPTAGREGARLLDS